MAAGKAAADFNAIIQADRKRKQNENLANQLLGKNRQTNGGVAKGAKKTQDAKPGSLASRIGVAKRPTSSPANPRTNPKPIIHQARPKARQTDRPGAKQRRPDEQRLLSALLPDSGQATVRGNKVGMTIKGAGSGPSVVVGSNFAPGTTAADIQAALEPVAGPVLSCWVITQHPAVSAEITFAERQGADSAIANFHNQRADGRIISMRLKPLSLGADNGATNYQNPQSPFNNLREQADRDRRSNRSGDTTIRDGNYGFTEQNQAVEPHRPRGNNRRWNNRGYRNGPRNGGASNQDTQETGLYSDQMMVDAPQQNPQPQGRRYHR